LVRANRVLKQAQSTPPSKGGFLGIKPSPRIKYPTFEKGSRVKNRPVPLLFHIFTPVFHPKSPENTGKIPLLKQNFGRFVVIRGQWKIAADSGGSLLSFLCI
jgi:hypothetical protein